MSLMNAIRRAVGGNGKPRLEDKREDDAEEEDHETEAEENRDDAGAEDDEEETSAEDDRDEPDAEDDDETEAEDEEEDKEAKKMSAAERSTFASGRRAERRRIGKILGSKAAEANPALAAHLAFRTSDKASKAIAALKAGGAASGSKLAGRMNDRSPSRTGRGGDAPRGGQDASRGWAKVLDKAGVKAGSRKR